MYWNKICFKNEKNEWVVILKKVLEDHDLIEECILDTKTNVIISSKQNYSQHYHEHNIKFSKKNWKNSLQLTVLGKFESNQITLSINHYPTNIIHFKQINLLLTTLSQQIHNSPRIIKQPKSTYKFNITITY